MTFKKLFPLVIALLALPFLMNAQVTTSSISGSVKQTGGESLAGATIVAVHIPSGTKYITVSKKGGSFTMAGLRPGGPYAVTVEHVGLKQQTLTDINLSLGEDYNANVTLNPVSSLLNEVIVTAKSSANVKSGVSTSVGQRLLTTLPTISRSITDFTRLTPQANGNSIGGRDGRYNNVTIDGANLNNNFGLSADALPGGGNNPISLDAIEEISVNIAPSDVRQSNFTGGNIVAVTKSGTNTFKGSVYTYYKDQSLIGTKVGNLDIGTQTNQKTNIYGGTFGGPIIKNKLFFFVNGEYEKKGLPYGTNYRPKGGSPSTLTSNVSVDSLKRFSDYLNNTYQYKTGAYDNFENFKTENYKILAKLDWNINSVHKVTAKYSEMVSTNDQLLNSTSVPNSGTSGANIWTSVARNGANAFSFENSNFAFKDIVKSGAVEVNSNWKGRFSNQLIATYTKIQTTRNTQSSIFPFIDIIGDPLKSGAAATYAGGAKNNVMSAGTDPYTRNNDVKNDIFNITENFNIYAGKHTITLGGAYEQQYVGNQYMPAASSYYTYGSLAEFMDPAAHPIAFALTYSRVPGNDAPYAAELKYGQMSFYAQDEVNLTSNLKISYGIRADKPTYPSNPIENASITALSFNNKNGVPTNYSTGKWPTPTFYFSPRASFRWDVAGDKKLVIRGGTGIYTGRIPFVYLTNMPTNAGVYQFGALATASQLSLITFNKDPKAWQSVFSTPTPTPPSGGFVLIDPNYKFPQVWRTNAGFDQKFNHGLTLSMDLMYTKDLNATVMRNANEAVPTSLVNLGGNYRPSFATDASTSRRINNSYSNAIILENANGGGSFSFTTQVSKAFNKGFYASLAYTLSSAMDYTANPGSQAASAWSGNFTKGSQNDLELSYSNFAAPHRFVGTFSYRKEYFNHLATTFSLFYEGSQYQSGRLSYTYGSAGGTAPTGFKNTADVNYDGNSADLMYIPKSPSDITFIPQTVGSGATAVTYTAADQSNAFFAFIAQDKYLRKHMGQVAERNGGQYPFYHRVDASIRQDIFTNIGGKRNTLQLTVDCFNFLNLISKNWGLRDFAPVFSPLRATKNATTGEVRYQLATYTPNGAVAGSNPILVDKTFIPSTSTSSTWSLLLGLRYIF